VEGDDAGRRVQLRGAGHGDGHGSPGGRRRGGVPGGTGEAGSGGRGGAAGGGGRRRGGDAGPADGGTEVHGGCAAREAGHDGGAGRAGEHNRQERRHKRDQHSLLVSAEPQHISFLGAELLGRMFLTSDYFRAVVVTKTFFSSLK
ncbi:hypothetical protein GW17_00055188, partial [Ensete ventricosum]